MKKTFSMSFDLNVESYPIMKNCYLTHITHTEDVLETVLGIRREEVFFAQQDLSALTYNNWANLQIYRSENENGPVIFDELVKENNIGQPYFIDKVCLKELQRGHASRVLPSYEELARLGLKSPGPDRSEDMSISDIMFPVTLETMTYLTHPDYQVCYKLGETLFDENLECIYLTTLYAFSQQSKQHPDYLKFYDYLMNHYLQLEGEEFLTTGTDLEPSYMELMSPGYHASSDTAWTATAPCINDNDINWLHETIAAFQTSEVDFRTYLRYNIGKSSVYLIGKVMLSLQHPELMDIVFSPSFLDDQYNDIATHYEPTEIENNEKKLYAYLKQRYLNRLLPEKNIAPIRKVKV